MAKREMVVMPTQLGGRRRLEITGGAEEAGNWIGGRDRVREARG